MRSYYPLLKAIYTYYAASSNAGSPFTMSMVEMRTLMTKCDLPMQHIEILWAETNYEIVKDDQNHDRELQRFEFIEMIIRLAFEHFVGNQAKRSIRNSGNGEYGESNPKNIVDHLNEGLVCLIEEHILPQAWRGIPHARFFCDPDSFRRERLYNEQVNKVLLSKCDELYSLFTAYARATQQREGNVVGGEHSPTLVGYTEFIELCKVSKLIGGPTKEEVKSGGKSKKSKTSKTSKKKKKGDAGESKSVVEDHSDNSLKTCRIAFALCQMTGNLGTPNETIIFEKLTVFNCRAAVVDELSRSKRKSRVDTQQHATFVEFLEALVRLTDMNEDPKSSNPIYQLSTSLGAVLEQIVTAHESINFWSQESGNTKRLWREYKKKFGQSRNAVKRRGYGPEVGIKETPNSNKEVVKRRLLSTEGVFAMGETSIAVLERKYAGGIATELRAQQKIDAANAVELEMKMNEEGGGQNGGK